MNEILGRTDLLETEYPGLHPTKLHDFGKALEVGISKKHLKSIHNMLTQAPTDQHRQHIVNHQNNMYERLEHV